METTLNPRKRAAETKKRRTRLALLRAARSVMRQLGMEARVEDIAAAAGVSVPTFYNFFKSRNDVCCAAFVELTVPAAEHGVSPQDSAADRLYKVSAAYIQDMHLLRAAMIGYWEKPNDFKHWPFLWVDISEQTGQLCAYWEKESEPYLGPVEHTIRLLASVDLFTSGADDDLVNYVLSSNALLLIERTMHGHAVAYDVKLATVQEFEREG